MQTPPPLPPSPSSLPQSAAPNTGGVFSDFIDGFKGLLGRIKSSPRPQPFKWYDRRPVVFASLVLFWPLGIACVWLTKRFEQADKWRLTAIGAAWALFLVMLPEPDKSSHQSSSGGSSRYEETSGPAISQVSWSEISNIYDVESSYTDLQKEENWAKYRGKTVVWSGEVVEVSRGMFGGTSLSIKMNNKTFTFDLQIELKRSAAKAAGRVHKGQHISFTGKLNNWGTLLPITLSDGEIIE